jgi:hypothetical protein
MNPGGGNRTAGLMQRLHGRTLKVIGLGGVGSPLAQALAQFLGVGVSSDTCLFLIDGDAYEERNRERVMFQHTGNKAMVKAQELSTSCGGGIAVVPVPKFVTPHNVARLISNGDCVFGAVDNHSTRRCLSNRCRKLSDVLLISGGNDGVTDRQKGTFGNVMIYERVGGRDVTSPLTRYHRDIAKPRDKRPDELGCAALVEASPQLLFANLAVAAAMLAAFYAWLTDQLPYEEIFLDVATARMQPVSRSRPTAAGTGGLARTR